MEKWESWILHGGKCWLVWGGNLPFLDVQFEMWKIVGNFTCLLGKRTRTFFQHWIIHVHSLYIVLTESWYLSNCNSLVLSSVQYGIIPWCHAVALQWKCAKRTENLKQFPELSETSCVCCNCYCFDLGLTFFSTSHAHNSNKAKWFSICS